MRLSKFFLSTLKEAPAEAELVSHRLMLRAGLIRKLGSGLYTWMPLGLLVLRKIEAIIRQEMTSSGAVELLMPAVQPAELWQESGRWDLFGPQMLKMKDRQQRDYCFGPTHEEVITDIARKELRSYRQLPVNFYQIQTKFRDEIRPRFGVMRAREFLMKDAYSFDADQPGLDRSYRSMYQAYNRIFTRLGLTFRPVAADPGAIGGTGSHEFHVLANSGEDLIAYCPTSDYAANVEIAEALVPPAPAAVARDPLKEVATPGETACEDVAAFLNISLQQMIKAIVIWVDGRVVMLLLRGDHSLNEVKVGKVCLADGSSLAGFRWATDAEIEAMLGCPPGFIGPVQLTPRMPLLVDRSVANMVNFVCGGNKPDVHYRGANFGQDGVREPDLVADLRNVVAGDLSPDGQGLLELCRGIEVGHVFKLGTKYSEALGASFIDEAGRSRLIEMGCYGIGVSRIVGAAIEQNFDARGIIWPRPMAPFEVALAPIGYRKSAAVREVADHLYETLLGADIDVILDDRDERPGVMFADLELIGVPHRITIGERGLKSASVEYQDRREEQAIPIPLASVLNFLQNRLKVQDV